MKNIIFLLFLLYISPLYAVEWVRIHATVDRNKISLGDRITYTLKVEYQPTIRLVLPQPSRELGNFEIVDYHITGPKRKFKLLGKGLTYLKHVYILTTYTTGEYRIPSIKIEYYVNGEKKELSSAEIPVQIKSIERKPGEPDDIRDIKSPVQLAGSRLGVFFMVLIPFFLTGGLVGYEFYQLKKIGRDIFAEPVDNRPPDVIALERLQKLQDTELLKSGQIKEFYIILSEIIRQYLAVRYEIAVLERTTFELYQELRPRERKYSSLMKELLEFCDLVKFAKYLPKEEENSVSLRQAKDIVEFTKPVVLEQVTLVNPTVN